MLFWTLLVLLIPNTTVNCAITYTNTYVKLSRMNWLTLFYPFVLLHVLGTLSVPLYLIYSESSLKQTPWGPPLGVLCWEVPARLIGMAIQS